MNIDAGNSLSRCSARNANTLPARQQMPRQRLHIQQFALPIRLSLHEPKDPKPTPNRTPTTRGATPGLFSALLAVSVGLPG